MGSFAIKLVDEGIEPFQLRYDGHGGWSYGFLFEGEVHALVTPILLRMIKSQLDFALSRPDKIHASCFCSMKKVA